VLGLLRAKELNADPDLPVEQAMRPGPSTYRPSVSVAEMRRIMADRDLDSSPVTTSDGRLVGLVRHQDIAQESAELATLGRAVMPVTRQDPASRTPETG
jgi:predicted transcriptional regulator